MPQVCFAHHHRVCTEHAVLVHLRSAWCVSFSLLLFVSLRSLGASSMFVCLLVPLHAFWFLFAPLFVPSRASSFIRRSSPSLLGPLGSSSCDYSFLFVPLRSSS